MPRRLRGHACRLALCLFLAVGFLMPAASPAMAQEVYDMERCVKRALEENPRIESSRAGRRAASEDVKSKWGALLPSVSTRYSYTGQYDEDGQNAYDDIFALNLNVHQDIFTGWRLLSSWERSRLSEEQAEISLENTELNLILLVQSNFLTLLKARDDVKSAQASVERLESQLKVTQAFYDVGLAPRLDVLEAEVDLAQAQDTLLRAENQVATQTVRLDTLLNLAEGENVDYEGGLAYEPFTLAQDAALRRAMENRPDIKLARKAVQVAVEDVTIARSPLFPQLTADWDLTRRGDSPEVEGFDGLSSGFQDWSVTVGASWRLFDWGENWYAWRAAKEDKSRLVAEAENTRLEAVFDVKSKHFNISEAAERIKVAQKALESAKEAYRQAVARYQAQVGTNTDVLDAQERLTTAEANLTEALADYRIALAELYNAIGEQNPALNVE